MKRFITIAILFLPALFACTETSESGSEGATSVVLSTDKVDLMVGETVTITATVLPESLGMNVVWSVLDAAYASVQGGTITALSEGVTYVVATSADGTRKAACMVSVNPEGRYSVTINNEFGMPLTGVYGYPGMTEILSAVTSDGEESHHFTWSVEDDAAGSITADGRLTLGAVASAGNDYVFDAQSFIRVVTEDGCGCRIPVRSSMLNGVRVAGTYEAAGNIITVEAEKSYPVDILYEGADGPAPIPADVLNIELSNPEAFSITKEGSAFTLVTGMMSDVSTLLSVSTVGTTRKMEVAEFKIDKTFPIRAQLVGSSSSTLSFGWTEGGEVSDDLNKPYTIELYKDEACTDLELSYSIPADDGCFKGKTPRFVFSGLAPATDYWFRVTDTSREDFFSDVIPAATEAFDIVMVSNDPAVEGTIILAEDFGQLCWGADEISEAAGFEVVDDSYGYNSDTKKSFLCRDAAQFVGITTQYAKFSLTAQATAKKEEGFRLAKWAQGQYGRMYVGPGYVFLSTTSYGTHIITPELTSIPEGKTAKLKVTLHAAGKLSGGKAALAVQHGKSFYEIASNNQTNKSKLDLSTNVETITYSGGITSLETFELIVDGVASGDRIAFGPTTETAKDNSNMMLLSDFTVQIVELK